MNASRISLLLAVLLSLPLGIASAFAVEAPENDAPLKPNILFIVLDDFGFGDLGANGSNAEVVTPHLDRFAAEGVRFTRNYVNASCTVTRAGILTGQQPERHGFRPDAIGISPEVTTLPEALQAAGYHTYHIGKWHLGYLSRLAWPTRQGYDEFYGFLAQNLLGGQRDGEWRFRAPSYRRPALQVNEEPPVVREGHLSDLLATHAEETIAQLATRASPWFLSVWTFAPHTPVDPHQRFAKRHPDTPAGKYLALIEQVDDVVGRILASLEQHGLVDDTFVMIVSDNGGTGADVDSNAPFIGSKTTFQQGGIRTPLLLRWPGRLEAGQVTDALAYYLDYYPTLATLAGAEPPAEPTGLNLLALLEGSARREHNFYWEAVNAKSQTWAAMSPDGRWRLQQAIIGPVVLSDLNLPPPVTEDLSAKHPDIARKLRADYLKWRLDARWVPLDIEPQGEAGHARVTGHSLLRAPGYGRYSFGIGVTLKDAKLESAGRQTIAYQRDMWHLYLEGESLHLKLKDIALSAPAPAFEECTSLILTTEFKPGQINPRRKRSFVQLYVNGDLAAEYDEPGYTPPAEGYSNPLYIGENDEGATRLRGVLGQPVILSEQLFAKDRDASSVENGIERVERTLCNG